MEVYVLMDCVVAGVDTVEKVQHIVERDVKMAHVWIVHQEKIAVADHDMEMPNACLKNFAVHGDIVELLQLTALRLRNQEKMAVADQDMNMPNAGLVNVAVHNGKSVELLQNFALAMI